jgi:hypothetical protein
MLSQDATLEAAVRCGALKRYRVELEQGEFNVRQLWMRPEIHALVNSGELDPLQRTMVRAALKRFIVGGTWTVVTKECNYSSVANLGDMRELKNSRPPFLEMRFKPPKNDLRFFGRCVGKDRLVLTTHGMKSLEKEARLKPVSVPEELKRCVAIFQACKLDITWVPIAVQASFSNVEFV